MMTAAILGLVLALVGLAAWEWTRILRSVYQLVIAAIAPSDRESSRPASPPQEAHEVASPYGPQRTLFSLDRPPSHSYLPAVFAVISSDPDADSFTAGVEIVLYVTAIVVAAFMVIGFVRKKLGE